jgi:hypothetical protein
MVAAGVIVIEGWHYCGPTVEQINAIAHRVAEIGQETWDRIQSPRGAGRLVEASPNARIGSTSQVQATAHANPPPDDWESDLAPAASTPGNLSREPAVVAPLMFSQSVPSAESSTSTALQPSIFLAEDANPLTMLLRRLEELGGIEPALEPWGESGNLYRFCCRATLADNPQITRHFEAVAAEQLIAVESVVAKVQLWRAERERSQQQ